MQSFVYANKENDMTQQGRGIGFFPNDDPEYRRAYAREAGVLDARRHHEMVSGPDYQWGVLYAGAVGFVPCVDMAEAQRLAAGAKAEYAPASLARRVFGPVEVFPF
jgi:hypothetical protein